MTLDDLLQPGQTLHLDYGEGKKHNGLVHIRAIIDDGMVVSRRWGKHKQRWFYHVESWYAWRIRADGGHITELREENNDDKRT